MLVIIQERTDTAAGDWDRKEAKGTDCRDAGHDDLRVEQERTMRGIAWVG